MNSPFSNNQNPNAGAMGAPIAVPMAADATAEARLNFIRLTYVMFTASVLTAVIGGIISLNTPLANLVMAFAPWSLLAILPLSIGAQMVSDKPNLGTAALFGFALLLGIIIAPVVNLYSPNTVTQAGALTVLIFGALTAYVFITRKDFNFIGGIVFVGLIACFGAGLLNYFVFKNSGFSYWIAWGVLLFSAGFVLYDTSNIMQRYPLNQPAGAALGLLISFFNIFMSLLRILNGRD